MKKKKKDMEKTESLGEDDIEPLVIDDAPDYGFLEEEKFGSDQEDEDEDDPFDELFGEEPAYDPKKEEEEVRRS